MGFDINNFGSMISNLGKSSAGMQKDETKIDTKSELNAYVSGWDAIKASAEQSGAEASDIKSLESDMKTNLASLMGAEFGESAGLKKTSEKEAVFSSEEISLENMMSLLESEDGLDIAKLREYNKKPMLSSESDAIDTLSEAGFSAELAEILMETTPGAINHITDAIKSGKAERIQNQSSAVNEYAKDSKDIDVLGWIQYDAI